MLYYQKVVFFFVTTVLCTIHAQEQIFHTQEQVEPVNAEPNGTLFIDLFVEHKADISRVLAYERKGITVQIKAPKAKQSLDDALLEFIAKVLEVEKDKLSVYKADGPHKVVRVDNSDLRVDDVMVKMNYEMYLK